MMIFSLPITKQRVTMTFGIGGKALGEGLLSFHDFRNRKKDTMNAIVMTIAMKIVWIIVMLAQSTLVRGVGREKTMKEK